MEGHLTIALDGMGGDHAPGTVVRGAAIALKRRPELRFHIFGNEPKIRRLMKHMPALEQASQIFHAETVIAADEKPSIALRQGRESSMRLAINDVKAGNAAAIVSAGNTGALMAMAKFVFKTLPGVSRPAIAALMPTQQKDCMMLDMGANIECDARNLFQFSVMGEAFCRAVLGRETPSIGILNVGSEDMKGHEYLRQTADMLRASHLADNFKGFIEGHHISEGMVDVVVTDGFTGNAVLKTAEGYARFIASEVRQSFTQSIAGRIAAPLALLALRRVKKQFDPNKRNGGMLLGLNGIAVKSHGGANARGYANAIGVAANCVIHGVNERIIEEIKLFDADGFAGISES